MSNLHSKIVNGDEDEEDEKKAFWSGTKSVPCSLISSCIRSPDHLPDSDYHKFLCDWQTLFKLYCSKQTQESVDAVMNVIMNHKADCSYIMCTDNMFSMEPMDDIYSLFCEIEKVLSPNTGCNISRHIENHILKYFDQVLDGTNINNINTDADTTQDLNEGSDSEETVDGGFVLVPEIDNKTAESIRDAVVGEAENEAIVKSSIRAFLNDIVTDDMHDEKTPRPKVFSQPQVTFLIGICCEIFDLEYSNKYYQEYTIKLFRLIMCEILSQRGDPTVRYLVKEAEFEKESLEEYIHVCKWMLVSHPTTVFRQQFVDLLINYCKCIYDY